MLVENFWRSKSLLLKCVDVFICQNILAAPSQTVAFITKPPSSQSNNKMIDLDFMRCAFFAAEDAVATTEYQDIWKKYSPAIKTTLIDFSNCIEQDNDEWYGCVSLANTPVYHPIMQAGASLMI